MRPLTLKTVLVATDLSDDDLPALRTAIELSRLAGAHLHVAHAAPAAGAEMTQAIDDHVRAADASSDVLTGTTIREGRPDRVIVEVAGTIDADVIVLGPHRPDLSRSSGGTAYRVAAIAERPCLVLPGMMRLPLGRILVPVDASGAARGALAVAMTWASALRRRAPPRSPESTELLVLHVETGEHPSAGDVLDDALSAVSSLAAAVAGVGVQRIAERGADPATAILERAAADKFDLIVLGTRAQTVASDLGSVSSAVVQSATCPLLLVPPRVWREHGNDPLPAARPRVS